MKTLNQLSSKARKRHLQLLAAVKSGKRRFFRGDCSFRMIERLHKAGLLTACVSKWNWAGGNRPFRELAVYINEQEARTHYPQVLPRK